MSAIDELVRNNEAYANSFAGELPLPAGPPGGRAGLHGRPD